MKKYILTLFLINLIIEINAQNCNAFLFQKDTCQYEACKIAKQRAGHYQYKRAYQEALDKALDRCPYYGHAFHNKSVAYLKSGDFVTWKKLIDKAVESMPLEYLGYRGWCRYQFFRDYKGAIDDIEKLDSMVNYSIGYSAGGAYHLNIGKALCYKALGQKEKAVAIIEKHLKESKEPIGTYDYLHLGVLYYELGEYDKAIQNFELQEQEYHVAEKEYYLAQVYIKQKEKAKAQAALVKAKQLYIADSKMYDNYTEQMDKIYLKQIETALASIHL